VLWGGSGRIFRAPRECNRTLRYRICGKQCDRSSTLIRAFLCGLWPGC
jgi:hypothetical protein